MRSLKVYVDPMILTLCFGGRNKGLAVTKQRMSHCVTDAISAAYEACCLALPLGVRDNSTRGTALSQTLFRGSSLEDICVVAGWSSQHTFIRFYGLEVGKAPGS